MLKIYAWAVHAHILPIHLLYEPGSYQRQIAFLAFDLTFHLQSQTILCQGRPPSQKSSQKSNGSGEHRQTETHTNRLRQYQVHYLPVM